MSIKLLEKKYTLKDEIIASYYEGIKTPENFKIGVEIEKINVIKNTFEAVPYVIIEQFLNIFSEKYCWQKIRQNGYIVGLKKDGHIISLEPGSQMEISLAPMQNIHQISDYLESFNKKSSKIADLLGFYQLGYGIQPVSTYEKINVIPKTRYHLMTDYFVDKGNMAYVMMRETAGTQVNFDYSSEEDAIKKLRLGVMLAPVVSAVFSNSPIRGGKNTGHKSFRAKSWLYTDNDRCGFINNKLLNPHNEFTFNDYVETLLDVPMIFVSRGEKHYSLNTTFRNYMENGYDGLEANMDDWKLHANLYFPEVRLKNFLEFRNADSQNPETALAIMALYKGIFYDDEAMNEAFWAYNEIGISDLIQMRNLGPEFGINFEILGKKINELAMELIRISKKSLQRQFEINNFFQDESIFLDIAEDMLLVGKTPADRVLEVCGDSVEKLVEYTKI